MKFLARIILVAGLQGHALLLPRTAAAVSQPPSNIVILHVDDLGWSDLGCYGSRYNETPVIDGLARQGIRFTQAYAGGPVCTPARIALLTGLAPARLHATGQEGYRRDPRIRKLWHPDFRTVIPVGTTTIAHTLSRAGYVCAAIGKYGPDENPASDGFAVAADDADDLTLADHAIDFLRSNRDRPFLLYFNTHQVHIPLQAADALVRKYQQKSVPTGTRFNPTYAACVEEMDQTVGRLLAEVDRLDLHDRTVVIFISDNGGFLGTDTDFVTTNAPLREGKASLYEGGIRVPLIVRWPGVTAPGSVSSAPVQGSDLHATLAALAGVSLPGHATADGMSFAPILRGEKPPARGPLFWHYPHYRRAMAGVEASPSSAIRDGDWKLIHFYEDDHAELYDLAADPGETRNLVSIERNRTQQLRRQLEGWRRQVDAQAPVPN